MIEREPPATVERHTIKIGLRATKKCLKSQLRACAVAFGNSIPSNFNFLIEHMIRVCTIIRRRMLTTPAAAQDVGMAFEQYEMIRPLLSDRSQERQARF